MTTVDINLIEACIFVPSWSSLGSTGFKMQKANARLSVKQLDQRLLSKDAHTDATFESLSDFEMLGSAMIRSRSLAPSVSLPVRRRVSVRVVADYEKVGTRQELDDGGGRLRGNVSGKKIFVQEYEGKLYCLSNVCTHLKLPLVGRTALLQGEVSEGCISCPAHKTRFNLETGAVEGEWAPTFPDIPFVGKGNPAPLPIYSVRETPEGVIEVEVPAE